LCVTLVLTSSFRLKESKEKKKRKQQEEEEGDEKIKEKIVK